MIFYMVVFWDLVLKRLLYKIAFASSILQCYVNLSECYSILIPRIITITTAHLQNFRILPSFILTSKKTKNPKKHKKNYKKLGNFKTILKSPQN